jgi:hypothetical protein
MAAQDDDEAEVLDEKPKNLIFHLVKQLTKGQDLTRVLIPTFFLEPRSLLEKFSDLMAHPHLLLDVPKENDPMKRLLGVTRWYLSGWHIRPKQCKKPYNPLLGEEFFCYWQHPDGSTSLYCAEQVCHHPPVSAIYVENRPNNITLNADIYTKSKFLGNSAASINIGQCKLWVCNRNEMYSMNFPTAYACGLFIGKLRMELGGKQTIVCKETGLMAEIEFVTKPFIGGDYNRIKGTIKDLQGKKEFYELEGKWDSMITIKEKITGKSEVFLDVLNTPIVKKYVSKLEDQGPWESRKVWEQVTIALKKVPADHDLATVHKTELEDAQRARKKERDEKKIPYNPKHFVQDNDGKWVYKRLNIKPYDPNEVSLVWDDIKMSHPQEDDECGLPFGALPERNDAPRKASTAAPAPQVPLSAPPARHHSVAAHPSGTVTPPSGRANR